MYSVTPRPKRTLSRFACAAALAYGGKDAHRSKPLDLAAREQTDLVVFLETLSTFSNPWRPEDNGRCD